MAETQPYVPDDVSLSGERRVDAVCRRFEAEWQAGRRPNPEEFLAGWDGPERVLLAQELALIDMDYRRQAGEVTTASNYRRLFTPVPTPTRPEADEPLPRAFGRYELRRLLGRGGMGSVYLAHDAQLDRDVALKIPRPFGENPTLWRERFFTEARAAAALRHENICPVHDVGEHDGQPYLTMAYIDGDTLYAKLRAVGRLPVSEAVGVVAAVARAMAEAHAAGVVHRDLKPGNIMVDRRGRPVVMDFGLALRTSSADDLRVTLTGVALGTPAYMPPEQAGGDVDAIGPPADVYALGVILFELVTGTVPFRAKSFGKLLAQIERDPPPLPSSLNADVPSALDALVLMALAKNPADRFPTAAEFADALDQFLAGRFDDLTSRYGAVLTRPDEDVLKTRAYPAPPRKRTNWRPAVAAGFLGLLLLVAGAVYVSTDKGELKVEFLDPDTGKPIAAPKDIDVKVNGQRVVLDPDGKPITVRAGDDQMLVVTGDDFVTESQTFTLKRWKDATVRVTLIPKERLAKKPDPVVPPPDVKPDPKPEEKPKPNPVEFPKAKTLIELPGWQVLCEATKDEMQAWLDERKKAKHSVTWLDAYPVAGKPLYSAVAALDDRQANWIATTAWPYKKLVENKLPDKATFSFHFPRSMAGLNLESETSVAMLWHPIVCRWHFLPNEGPAVIARFIDASKAEGFVPSLLRPTPAVGGDSLRYAYSERLQEEGMPLTLPYILPDRLEHEVKELRKAGRRPTSLSAAVVNDQLTFAMTTTELPSGGDWDAEYGLTTAQMSETAKKHAERGMYPDTVTAYAWDGAVRYCVVWVKDPPKPTPYPKDKVLVKAGDYETLLDATKEQMQAWLDEKKKAKHSVLWLDAVQVGDKPLFSAVAALDDRAANWGAVLDLDTDEYNDGGKIDELFTAGKERAYALSGYPNGGKIRCAILWGPGKLGGHEAPDVALDSLGKLIKDNEDAGCIVELLRPYSISDAARRTAFISRRAIGQKSIRLLDKTSAELDTFLADVRKQGARPLSVTASVPEDTPRFTATAVPNPDKWEWEVTTGLPAAKLADAVKEKGKVGFHPHSVTAYPWDGAVRYCVVWVKDPPKPTPYPKDKTLIKQGDYETLLDATKEQMQAWLDEKKKAKHSVLWLDAVEVAGKPLFSAVAALDDRQPNWTAMLDISADDASSTPAMRKLINTEIHTVISMGGFVADGEARAALLWADKRRKWMIGCGEPLTSSVQELGKLVADGFVVRLIRPFPAGEKTLVHDFCEAAAEVGAYSHALNSVELEKFLADRRKDDSIPAAVSGYSGKDGLRFAVVCRPNKGKAEWEYAVAKSAADFTGQSAARSKAGFRPESVTAYAWDGAVRYCVVWVKDPPKPTPYPKDKTLIKQGDYETLLDATKEQMQTWLDEKKKAKQSVLWLDAVLVGGKPLYCGLAALDDRVADWRALLDEPVVKLSEASAALKAAIEGRRFAAMAGYVQGEKPFNALLLHPSAVRWQASGDKTAGDLEDWAGELKKHGYGYALFRPYAGVGGVPWYAVAVEPTATGGERKVESTADRLLRSVGEGQRLAGVSAYPEKGELRFAAVTRPTADAGNWGTDTGLTADQLAVAWREQAKKGFGPESVTAYAWDGAVRYCVVWVKDPPKKEEKKDLPPKKDK